MDKNKLEELAITSQHDFHNKLGAISFATLALSFQFSRSIGTGAVDILVFTWLVLLVSSIAIGSYLMEKAWLFKGNKMEIDYRLGPPERRKTDAYKKFQEDYATLGNRMNLKLRIAVWAYISGLCLQGIYAVMNISMDKFPKFAIPYLFSCISRLFH